MTERYPNGRYRAGGCAAVVYRVHMLENNITNDLIRERIRACDRACVELVVVSESCADACLALNGDGDITKCFLADLNGVEIALVTSKVLSWTTSENRTECKVLGPASLVRRPEISASQIAIEIVSAPWLVAWAPTRPRCPTAARTRQQIDAESRLVSRMTIGVSYPFGCETGQDARHVGYRSSLDTRLVSHGV
jgi:hypothetical protein